MCLHLKDSLLDFGPLSAFWCFPFERFNGTLEGFKKSWTGPEKQMFMKFINMQHIYWLQTSNNNDLVSIICKSNELLSGSLESLSSFDQTQVQDVITLNQIDSFTCNVASLDATEKSFQHLLPPLKEKCFNDAQFSDLNQMYNMLYPNLTITNISRFFYESKTLTINGEEFISSSSR